MSVSGEGEALPSAWAVERFGRSAGTLAAVLPVQLARAHERAHAVHLTGGLKRRLAFRAPCPAGASDLGLRRLLRRRESSGTP